MKWHFKYPETTKRMEFVHVRHLKFILLGILFMAIFSCKKDEDNPSDPVPTPPITVLDIDSNIYHVVIIGTQTWMKENLKTTRYRDGTQIPNEPNLFTWDTLTTGAYCDYNNNSTNSDVYGRLYNWYVASDTNLCPTGWHVPSAAEFGTLSMYLGGDALAGGALKEAGTTHWESPNTGATNSTGFTALPGGGCDDPLVGFTNITKMGNWWTTTEILSDALRLRMWYDSKQMLMENADKNSGYSVRCLKN